MGRIRSSFVVLASKGRCRATAGVLATAFLSLTTISASAADLSIDFETDIRPLLVNKCQKCHGPNKQEGGLRLDSHAAVLSGGDSGPLLALQDSGHSLLMEAVRRESLEMPPDEPLPAKDVARLARWVAAGAPWPKVDAPLRNHRTFTEEERQFWSLRPISKPTVPAADTQGWARGVIDQFAWRQLAQQNKQPAPEANRYELLRRLCFDLWGMPPSRKQIDTFIADQRDDAYERLVDRLLASPRYGERSAQHWLDLVRYADSDGFKRDDPRPHAWRYRDYVIGAFNKDLPYDKFVAEQLAGDEIAPDNADVVVATGYLYCGIYESNQANIWTQRIDLLNDITDVTGDVFLGLSMSCARCHDHKFDPILQEDYYRLQAFFTPLVLKGATTLHTPEQEAQRARWKESTADVRSRLDKIVVPHMNAMRKSRMDRLDRKLQNLAARDASTHSPFEKTVAALIDRQINHKSYDLLAQMNDEERGTIRKLEKELAKYDDERPKNVVAAHIAADVGAEAPPTHIPGHANPRDILPGPLSILDTRPFVIETPAAAPTSTGRRSALARWLTSSDNPLTARVMVNRVWQHHFGEGLVSTPSNFGITGESPRDAKLLDYLATRFVEEGWSLKKLHREIVLSATYRQQNDGSNNTPWRFQPRRLEGEQLRDALVTLADQLDVTVGGPAQDDDSNRRSIYLKKLRNSPLTMFAVYDVPERIDSVAKRDVTTTPVQALLAMNDPEQQRRVQAIVERVHQRADGDNVKLINEMFLSIFNRPPTPEDQQACQALLKEAAGEGQARTEAIADIAWAMLNSHEFLFVR